MRRLFLAYAVGRRVAAPIQTLTAAADRIGRDPSCTMLPRMAGPREVVRLSGVLRLLLCRVGVAEQTTVQIKLRASEEARTMAANIDKLRRLAESDPLTGVYNRAALLAVAETIVADGSRDLAVMMIDIDHFKSINDRYGHAAGDAVIRTVAETILANVRAGDKVARFGGEEFIVLMPGIDAAALAAQGERIRRAIEAAQIAAGEKLVAATASCGGAAMIADDADVRDVIERADRALYRAKDEGRNRACLAPDPCADQYAA